MGLKPKTRDPERGFTLLEVMVATLVMAIAVTGLLSALSTSLRNAARLTEYDRAALLARQKMDELLLSKDIPESATLEGAWDPSVTSGEQMGWKARLTPFDAPQQGPYMPFFQRIELEVWWIAGGNRKTFTLDGFRRSIFPPPGPGT